MFKTALLAIVTVSIFMAAWSLMVVVFDRDREKPSYRKDRYDDNGEGE